MPGIGGIPAIDLVSCLSAPSAANCRVVSASRSCFAPFKSTVAPARNKASAMARPSPRGAPVTKATFPCNENMIFFEVSQECLGLVGRDGRDLHPVRSLSRVIRYFQSR